MKRPLKSLPKTIGKGVRLKRTADAEDFFSRLPADATTRVFDALGQWLAHQPLRGAQAEVEVDYEDPSWQELVLELWIDAEGDAWLALWDELGSVIDEAMAGFSKSQVDDLDQRFAVHLASGPF